MMVLAPFLKAAVRPVLDYALPPRCPACGVIVDMPGVICAPCWISIDFIGEPICVTCGVDLPSFAGEEAKCAPCLANPQPYDQVRAVMLYGEVGRTVAHRLKYGRRLSLARVMAEHMARLLPSDRGDRPPLLVPVPLHRWRIWSRGFNQSALIARHLSARSGLPVELDLLRRIKATPPLHTLRRGQRRDAIQGAFALSPGARTHLAGRTVILIDDIWTTGGTASACARLLRQGGAERIDVLCWARVSAADH